MPCPVVTEPRVAVECLLVLAHITSTASSGRCGLFLCMCWRSMVCVSLCLSVCLSHGWAQQKQLNWLRCHLGGLHLPLLDGGRYWRHLANMIEWSVLIALATYSAVVVGPVFGGKDYFTGLGIFLDTYANQNGPHNVSYRLCFVILLFCFCCFLCFVSCCATLLRAVGTVEVVKQRERLVIMEGGTVWS